jgi:hypothetical protein
VPNVPLAPLLGAVNVTFTVLTRLPLASFTVAWSAVAKAVPVVALCGVPPVAAMLAGGPGLLVKLKLAGAATPVTLAATVYPPAMALAVNAGAVATPLLLVGAVAVSEVPNLPLAPLLGAVKITFTAFSGLPLASVTVAWRAVANAVFMPVFCGVPP